MPLEREAPSRTTCLPALVWSHASWLPRSYVVVTSSWEQLLLWTPPGVSYHLHTAWWRWLIAAGFIGFTLYGLYSCWTSEACAGVGPLILLMPGANVGAVLIVLVIITTIVLPFLSDMFEHVTPQTNPTAFFLILPCLVFAVLFWGMSLHWVKLLWDGEPPPHISASSHKLLLWDHPTSSCGTPHKLV